MIKFYFIDRQEECPLFLNSHTVEEARAERRMMSSSFDTEGVLIEFGVRNADAFVYELYSMDCDIIEALQVWYTEKTELTFGYFEIVDYPTMDGVDVTEETANDVRTELRKLLLIYEWTKEADDISVTSDGIYIGGNVRGWISYGSRVMYVGWRSGAMVKLTNGEFFSIQPEIISVYSFDDDEYKDSFYLDKRSVYEK